MSLNTVCTGFEAMFTSIFTVGVTSSSSLGYWISSTELISEGSSGLATETPSGQYTSTLVATSLPVHTQQTHSEVLLIAMNNLASTLKQCVGYKAWMTTSSLSQRFPTNWTGFQLQHLSPISSPPLSSQRCLIRQEVLQQGFPDWVFIFILTANQRTVMHSLSFSLSY